MGIYIKGMKMPSKADACIVIRQDGLVKYYGQLSKFRAVEVPDGHGRLISARAAKWAFDDAIMDEAKVTGIVRATSDEIAEVIASVTTIIPADKEAV